MSTLVKKSIGTFVFLGLIFSAVAFTVPADARAQFINSMFGLVADGVVAEIDGDSLVLLTSGAEPIEMAITYRTRIVRGPVEAGDQVKVTARVRNGETTALVIKKTGTGPGYGHAGDRVLVSKAKVVSKDGDSFTVESSVGVITFEVTASTRFYRTSFSNLEEGDWVKVIGEDSGDAFVARLVLGERKHRYSYRYGHGHSHDHDMHSDDDDHNEDDDHDDHEDKNDKKKKYEKYKKEKREKKNDRYNRYRNR